MGMKILPVVLLLVSASCILGYAHMDIGDQIHRTYTVYDEMPITASDAKENDWVANASASCDPNLGVAYTYKQIGATESSPLTLYFTPFGQLAGVGVTIHGSVESNLLAKGFIQPAGDDHQIVMSFRNASVICSTTELPNVLGDSLTINQNTIAYALPLTEVEAVAAGFIKGSCFSGMGYHYFYDLATHPEPSWVAGNLLPIVPMYNNGSINAFFFADSTVQQGLTSAHWWEPVPLPNFAMCKNWCDKSCTFSGTHFWSTLHIYLKDYKQVTCPNGCTIGCCPSP